MFLEYKFTIAHYEAPMTGRDGGWFPQRFLAPGQGLSGGAQFPSAGCLSTVLASHQVAAGRRACASCGPRNRAVT